MDGLDRRETRIPAKRVRQSDAALSHNPTSAKSSNEQESAAGFDAYVVGGRDVLQTWNNRATVVVLLPDHNGNLMVPATHPCVLFAANWQMFICIFRKCNSVR